MPGPSRSRPGDERPPGSPGPLGLVAAALRGVIQRADESPADILPLLYSTLRREQHDDEEIERLLDLGADDVPLRIASYRPEPDGRVRVRPPAPVVAIHAVDRDRITVVRCTTALMFLQDNRLLATAMASGLVASALSPDGALLMTGHADGTITFWNTAIGQVTERFAAHRTAVTHVLMMPQFAYSCAADCSIVRWEHRGQEWERTRFEGPAGITSATASAGDYLAVGCANGDILELAGTSTNLHARAHDGPVTGLALRDDDHSLVSAGADRMLRACMALRPDTAVKIASEHTHGITGLEVSPSPEAFATYSPDRTVRLWSVARTSTSPEIQAVNVFTEHKAAVTSFCFALSRKLQLMVSGSADGDIVVRWAGSTIARLHAHEGPVRAIACLSDRTLLTGGDDVQLQSWDMTTSSVRRVPPDGVTSLSSGRGLIAWCRSGQFRTEGAFTEDGEGVVAQVRADGQRVLVQKPGELEVFELDASGQGPITWLESPIVAALYEQNSAYVAIDDDAIVELPTRRRFRRVTTSFEGGTRKSVDYLEESRRDAAESRLTCAIGQGEGPFVPYILAGNANGSVVQIPVGPPSSSLPAIPLASHTAPVTALAFFPGTAPVASAAADGSVIVWTTGQKPSPLFRGNHNGRVRHLAFLNDTALASAGDDRLVILWNFRNGQRIATCAGHRDIITALLLDSRSQLIYTASLDSTVRVWNFEGTQRGIVYGSHPFSTLALIHDNVMPGEVVAGDDAGALWTLALDRKVDVEATPRVATSRPTRKQGSRRKKPMMKRKPNR